MTLRYLGKHILIDLDKWPFLFLHILSVIFSPSCILVQRRKYLQWRDDWVFLQNGSAIRKSQAGWPLTFCLKDKHAASFYRLHSKYGLRSFWNTQNFNGYCTSKIALFMSQSDFDPRTNDLTPLCSRILY